MVTIALDSTQIQSLDLSPVTSLIEDWRSQNVISAHEQQISFAIEFPLDDTDPRELSEIPEIRLWFIRLDTVYPWFPFLLDPKASELVRYTAMLVPHQFHRSEGIQFNPEALEIYVMGKLFVLADWLKAQNLNRTSRLTAMAQLLGYELDSGFWQMLT
jgi:hypothetical protein